MSDLYIVGGMVAGFALGFVVMWYRVEELGIHKDDHNYLIAYTLGCFGYWTWRTDWTILWVITVALGLLMAFSILLSIEEALKRNPNVAYPYKTVEEKRREDAFGKALCDAISGSFPDARSYPPGERFWLYSPDGGLKFLVSREVIANRLAARDIYLDDETGCYREYA